MYHIMYEKLMVFKNKIFSDCFDSCISLCSTKSVKYIKQELVVCRKLILRVFGYFLFKTEQNYKNSIFLRISYGIIQCFFFS